MVWHLGVGSSHPGVGVGPKGSAVCRLKSYASWVQNVVRQFGPYPSWAQEICGDLHLVRAEYRDWETRFKMRSAGALSPLKSRSRPGIVMDISKYMNKILEFSQEEHWVWVEPGVIPAELNKWLAPHGLLYGPETSTANRVVS